MKTKPLIKWAGGKSQILFQIREKYPTELGKSIKKYAEPFVGGGAVLFDVLNNYNLDEIYIGDINRELILTYTDVRDNAVELIKLLKNLEGEYLSTADKARKELYYINRGHYNALKSSKSESVELAALFIFLNKTCFNGLYRVNSKGGFNVPQGSYKNPKICDEDGLQAVSKALQGVKIICGDYKKSADFIDENTFAYFDPPYRPLTTTASFTAYANDGFGDREQAELARFITEMSERGARVVASNSDPKNADESDEFFDSLYSKHKITRISAHRMINSVGAGRGRVNELLIANA
ncbi:MAG: Dam family site-specific DNA-(adenine-N6)-methyltransferase [Oscillospiraceae bacterium]|nr:Dam family site-specific DNA-(adenine-N6)-methyltransferase [Oscillospiraceae bacterium]